MRGRVVEDRIEERICKIRVLDGVIAKYYPQEELIRCKDCYWHYGTMCRNNNTMPWEDEDFCSDAEREEE